VLSGYYTELEHTNGGSLIDKMSHNTVPTNADNVVSKTLGRLFISHAAAAAAAAADSVLL